MLLPSLSSLRTSGPSVRDLPPELLKIVLDNVNSVPLMLIRQVNHAYNSQTGQNVHVGDSVAYLRLPDPKTGQLDVDRFKNDGYPFAELLANIVEHVGYNANTRKTLFLDVNITDDTQGIANFLIVQGADGYDVAFMVGTILDYDGAGSLQEKGLAFAHFPEFASHVAIVLTLNDSR